MYVCVVPRAGLEGPASGRKGSGAPATRISRLRRSASSAAAPLREGTTTKRVTKRQRTIIKVSSANAVIGVKERRHVAYNQEISSNDDDAAITPDSSGDDAG